jgi:hypothetical protein
MTQRMDSDVLGQAGPAGGEAAGPQDGAAVQRTPLVVAEEERVGGPKGLIYASRRRTGVYNKPVREEKENGRNPEIAKARNRETNCADAGATA